MTLDDRVADALEALANALTRAGLSARIRLQPADAAPTVQIDIGRDHTNGRDHVLRAKPATGEGSHLDLEGI